MAVLDLSELEGQFPMRVAEALALVAGMPERDDYEQMMWLLKRFNDDTEGAELFEERFQAAQSAYEALAPDPVVLPHLDDYRRLVRVRAIWRRGARLDQRDSDFDLLEYRQTWALVREARRDRAPSRRPACLPDRRRLREATRRCTGLGGREGGGDRGGAGV